MISGWLAPKSATDVVGCPYIEAWFAKHADSDAWTVEAMAKKYSGLKSADNATDYIAPIIARLQRGIARWQAGQDISSELNAAGIGGSAGAVVQSAAAGVAEPGSVMALEEQLGAGASMDSAAAARIGAGSDASDVRVHEGPAAAAQAAARNAVAFAVGNNIVMGANAPKPGTTLGDALLAHEYAHTKQQRDANQDPAARRQAIGEEQAGPEVNADEAVVAALTGLGAKWHDVMKTGLQLQRCSSDNTPAAGKVSADATKGNMAGSTVGFVPSGRETRPLIAGRTLRTVATMDAAIAVIRANGKGGAISAENGMFVAYEILGGVPEFGTSYGEMGMAMETTSVAPGVLMLITETGTILRPGPTGENETSKGGTTAEDRGQQQGDPFQGYIDAFGDGKSLNGASEAQILVTFDAAMKDTALSVLARSEAETRTKKAKYDKGTGVGGVAKDEIENLRQTAKDLSPVEKELDYVRMVADVDGTRGMAAGVLGQGGDLTGLGVASMYSAAEIDAARARIKTLEPQRAAILARAPMLARIPWLQLQKFAALPDDQITARMGSEMPGILSDIQTTRANILSGDIDLWELDSVVNATIAGLGIKDDAKRKVIMDKQKAKSHDKTVSMIVRTVFSVAFGLAAAFATGGLSLAFAAGAFGLGLYDAVEQTDDYFAKKAASNTDLDPNAAMLPKELVPGWGWLVVAWVGVGLDASQVVTSIKAIGKVERIAAEARVLSRSEYKKLGFATAEALEARLTSAAGIVDTGQAITEASRGVVAAKVGTSIEIHAGLPAGQIEVHYVLEAGRVRVVGMKVAEGASVAEVLAHSEVVRLLKRYEGATGRVRELMDKLRSFAKMASSDANPFPPGSKAFESWLEAKKLPGIIEARTKRLGAAVGTAQEAQLRVDVQFLENELKHHEAVVKALQLEQGVGFVATYGDASKLALKRGLHLPDVPPGTELTDEVIRNSGYYYRSAGTEFELVRKADSGGKALKPVLKDGKQVLENGVPTFIENVDDMTRAEKAAELVASFPKDKQAAYEAFRVAQEALGNKVVPIKGIFVTGKKFKDVAKKTEGFRTQFVELIKKALVASGKNEIEAAKRAGEAADRFLSKQITVIQGTDQLRAFGYQAHFVKTTGTAASELEELHHMVPLYLGGEHVVDNLINVSKKLHDELHDLMNTLKFDGVRLAPFSMQNMKVSYSPGLAVIDKAGIIEFRTLAEMTVIP